MPWKSCSATKARSKAENFKRNAFGIYSGGVFLFVVAGLKSQVGSWNSALPSQLQETRRKGDWETRGDSRIESRKGYLSRV